MSTADDNVFWSYSPQATGLPELSNVPSTDDEITTNNLKRDVDGVLNFVNPRRLIPCILSY